MKHAHMDSKPPKAGEKHKEHGDHRDLKRGVEHLKEHHREVRHEVRHESHKKER